MTYIILFLLLLIAPYYLRTETNLVIYDEEKRHQITFTFAVLFKRYRVLVLKKRIDDDDPRLNLLEVLLMEWLHGKTGQVRDEERVSKPLKTPLKKLPKKKKIPPYIGMLQQALRLCNRFFSYTIIEHLDWKSRAGCNDAMMTALGTGFLWALKGSVLGPLSSRCRIENVFVDVSSDYLNTMFFSSITCIVRIRIAHIIIIAVWAIVLIVRWWINGFTAGKTQPSH